MSAIVDSEALFDIFKQVSKTNVTKTVHKGVYPAVSPSRPELNQAGKVVLITGGGTGVGFNIAEAFVRASADTVIIISRRTEVLEKAASNLAKLATTVGTSTKILTRSVDVLDFAQVNALWEYLAAQRIFVDVLVANVGLASLPKSLSELGADAIWSFFDINVKAPIYFTEKFTSQAGDKKKYLVNVSSAATHMAAFPVISERPVYTLTKLTAAHFFELTAQHVSPEKMQVINFHPGQIWSQAWERAGMEFPRDVFDDDELCGAFAVWAASDAAQFFHGRFAWASWDVEELATGELRKRIDEDPYFLRTSISGLNGSNLA